MVDKNKEDLKKLQTKLDNFKGGSSFRRAKERDSGEKALSQGNKPKRDKSKKELKPIENKS